MKKSTIYKIKSNKVLSCCTRAMMNVILFFMKTFVAVNKKQILFLSFNGVRYDDSPYALYRAMLSDPYFDNYEFIWAFVAKDDFIIPRGGKVAFHSLRYFKAVLQSGIWITNVSVERGYRLKRKDTIYLNTWHGTPLKKIGKNAADYDSCIKSQSSTPDIFCAQSNYDKQIFSDVFSVPIESIITSDLPRNDELLRYTINDKKCIRNKLGIAEDKKVILYMPTYRSNDITNDNCFALSPPIHIKKWAEVLAAQYVMLIRTHYLVEKQMCIQDTSFVKSMSNYPKLNDLYAIADVMISDYSSVYFDFALLEKPMICFAYDKESYLQKPGIYFDLSELPGPIFNEEEDIIAFLKNLNANTIRLTEFKNKFAPNAGKATMNVLQVLKQHIEEKHNIKRIG